MPLVRMLTSVAGTGMSPTWEIGDEVEMSAAEAATWADGVRGELVRAPVVEVPESRVRQVETPEGSSRRVRRVDPGAREVRG